MTLMLFVYFICSIVYIVVGILAFVNNKKSRTNQMFFIAAINMTFWSLCLALMSISKTAETAALFRKLTWISYSTVYAQFLYFVFALTGKEHLIRGIWRKALFYTPAVVSLVLSMIRVFPAEYMQQTWYGWAYIGMPYEGFMWEDFFNLYYITYVIFGIILLFAHWRDARLIRERKRSKIIALSFSSALVLGTFSDIILPRFAKTVLPPFAVIIIMAGILAILYSMREHGLMSISAERVAREISRVTNEGVLIFDHNDKLISANPGAQRKLKFSQEELQQEDVLQSMLPPPLQSAGTPHENMECELTCADGAQLPVLVNAHVLRDRFGDKMGTVLNFRDITEVRKVKDELIRQKENLARTVEERTSDLMASKRILEKEIELRIGKENIIKNMAYYDQLTGLPNRRMFNRTLTDDIESAQAKDEALAVLYIDLDGLKIINDIVGHNFGDRLLIQVSNRIKQALRRGGVFRLGGDEFAVISYDAADTGALRKLCEAIISGIEEPYAINQNELRVSANIGVALFPKDGWDAQSLLKCADIAMCGTKDEGIGRYAFYSSNMEAGLEEKMRLTNALYGALERDELEVYYQPQVSVQTHEITGFEALLRWHHPELGLVSPGRFIPIAERTGLIEPIGKWVLETACRQLKTWNDKYGILRKMAVNLSIRQICSAGLVGDVKEILKRTGADPRLVELEVTESMLVEDVDSAVGALGALKELDINIALDDFGNEYSSLNYLKVLDINRIKIPKSFIDGVGKNKSDESIILSTVALAKDLGLNVVAEGVEHIAQLDYLKNTDCDDIQGFYFYKPMPAEDAEAHLKGREAVV